jgi:hypothetical protein
VNVPGHEILGVLRQVPGQRAVFESRVGGEACVTRVLLSEALEAADAAHIRDVVVSGAGSVTGLSEAVALTLEGYRVAASRLGAPPSADAAWPVAVDAGLTENGWVYVTMRWMTGTPLHQLGERGRDVREAVAVNALRVVAALHARNVVHGDLKPANLVADEAGAVALIDLDTLREVAPGKSVPTRDLTPDWAAPEQRRERRTSHASDVWAWAGIVDRVFPEGAPEAWGRGVRACRRPDAPRRPTAASLLAWLEDPERPLVDMRGQPVGDEVEAPAPSPVPAGATERVPESRATERVPEGPSQPTLSRTAAAPRAPAGAGCMALVLPVVAGLALVGLLAVGLYEWWFIQRQVRATEMADTVMEGMKRHKTDATLNVDPNEPARLRRDAEAAVEVARTPHTLAVRALARAWDEGWQFAKRFDEAVWSKTLKLAGDPACAGQPEAALARATLRGAACRRRRSDVPSFEDCQAALGDIDSFFAEVPAGDEWNWLRVEGAWQDVLVRDTLAARLLETGSPEAAQHLSAATKRCAGAEGWLAWAPVNGVEMAEDCLTAMGLAGNVDGYLHWSPRIVAAARQGTKLKIERLEKLYTAAGVGCAASTLKTRRNALVASGPAWCLALGHAARGCPADASAELEQGVVSDPSRPWDALGGAIAGLSGEGCVE